MSILNLATLPAAAGKIRRRPFSGRRKFCRPRLDTLRFGQTEASGRQRPSAPWDLKKALGGLPRSRRARPRQCRGSCQTPSARTVRSQASTQAAPNQVLPPEWWPQLASAPPAGDIGSRSRPESARAGSVGAAIRKIHACPASALLFPSRGPPALLAGVEAEAVRARHDLPRMAGGNRREACFAPRSYGPPRRPASINRSNWVLTSRSTAGPTARCDAEILASTELQIPLVFELRPRLRSPAGPRKAPMQAVKPPEVAKARNSPLPKLAEKPDSGGYRSALMTFRGH